MLYSPEEVSWWLSLSFVVGDFVETIWGAIGGCDIFEALASVSGSAANAAMISMCSWCCVVLS